MRWILLVTGALVVAACGADYWRFESVQTTDDPHSSLVVVWISDSPVDGAEQLEVTIERVELVPADGPGLPETLDASVQTHDLLALRNGVRARVGEAEVPSGDYTALRLTLRMSGALAPRMRVAGAWHPLVLAPGAAQTIEVPYTFTAPESGRREIQIDFNARLSVREVGGAYELDPVLDAVDPGTAGEITGRVLTAGGAPVSGAIVIIRRQGVELRSTITLPDGTYRLTPLAPGTYDVEIVGAPVVIPGVLVSTDAAVEVLLAIP